VYTFNPQYSQRISHLRASGRGDAGSLGVAGRRGLLDEDMSNTPFLLKAVSGLLIAAAAPVYCVWCLRKMSMEGTIRLPQNTRAKLERSFETTLLKYPDKPESSNGS
jgi:hypothetical protein